MAVALRGYTQGSVAGVGYSVAWPAGTVAGDVALVHCDGSMTGLGPQSSGWSWFGHRSWWKVLTAADLASALVVNATHVKLQVLSGAGGMGRGSSQPSLTTSVAGSAVWLDGAGSSPLAPDTYRLGSEWTDEDGRTQGAYLVPTTSAGYVTLPGAAAGAEWYAYEVVPSAPPAAPTLLAPSDPGHVDRMLPVAFAWRHESGMPQVAYRLKATTDLGTRWLNAAGSWVSSETDVATDVQSVTCSAPPTDLSDGAVWSVATKTAAGWGPYSATRTLWLDRAHWVTSVSVAASAGDLSPTVSWVESAGGTYGGTAFTRDSMRVRVTPAGSTSPDAGTIYDSGPLTGASPHDVASSTPWTNGSSYRAWVTLYGRGMESSLSSSPFTVSWTPAPTPSVWVGAAAVPQVTVGGLTTGYLVQVEQSSDGGVSWQSIATRTASGSSLVVDVPLAVGAVAFRARQGGLVDGAVLWSAWAVSATTTVARSGCMLLVDDADRSQWVECHLHTDDRRTLVQGIATSYGLGATSARVDRTPTAGQRGLWVLGTDTRAEREALVAWLGARSVWWAVLPPDDGQPDEVLRVARISPLVWDRIAESSPIPDRHLPVEWVEQ